ncbi:hypothetical protein F0365_13995 [Nonlabens sp. Ci31]|jgi:ABC-type phosphate transport system ATPase subunit|uniref:UPF0158 family protein n=1 Tax=Nonlabens sp. Ci31 TaxID=2608253 RepID=UPI0014643717|nr:UPF0158 family protein [Nonlabens sp. Ci31]QJP35432.1 hypothetical protein F0365_13995 [Nonlabens sp. Ci31]
MENSKSKIIKKIAEEIDCGFDCYYNPKNEEIITIPNLGQVNDEEEFQDAFSAELKKVKQNKAEFIKFGVLESYQSFKIMELFTHQIDNVELQSELEIILQKRKPFQNFKHVIDNSDYRKKWFDFKKAELEIIVETELERR